MNKLTAYSALVVATVSSVAYPAPSAGQCAKQSPSHAVALVELYTSEGCSSCPPADRWISQTATKGYSIDDLIRLSLHVDYWDQLGWKDNFASRKFSERQSNLAGLANSRTVYTPEVFLNLRELRSWDSTSRFQEAVRQINAKPANADIRLEITAATPTQFLLQASFKLKPGVTAKQPNAIIVLYENKLVNVVAAGENRGVTLHHDYVVREWIGPVEIAGGTAEYRKTVKIEPAWNSKNLGAAAFIQDFATQEVFQATALPVCSYDKGFSPS
jgi:hypothetical protein